MNIVINIDDIDNRNIFLGSNIKNTIIENGIFYKLKYSNHVFTLNNLFIKIDINEYKIFKNYSRYKCIFDANKYRTFIDKISALEHSILGKIERKKNTKPSISNILLSGTLKLSYYPNSKETIALKLSGIWETLHDYGLTYKFVIVSK